MRLAKQSAAKVIAPIVGSMLCAMLCLALCACSQDESADEEPVFSTYDETQVAATVNGEPIYESDITRSIELLRFQDDAADNLTWARVLEDADLTPSTLREKVIKQYIQDKLVVQECRRLNIDSDTSSIDDQIDDAKKNFGTTAEWTRALYRSGYYSEDAYRRSLVVSDLSDKLKQQVTSMVSPTNDELEAYISSKAYEYSGKRSSCILIIGTSSISYDEMKANAQSILDEIRSGSISFEDAAGKYSADKASAGVKGDIGWSSLVDMPRDYQTTLEDLPIGQVSDLVSCSYGIYIIKCTDVFTVPYGVSVDVGSVPSEIRTAMRSKLVTEQQGRLYSQYLSDLYTKADIQISEMPSGLSYNVDMDILRRASESTESISQAMTASEYEKGHLTPPSIPTDASTRDSDNTSTDTNDATAAAGDANANGDEGNSAHAGESSPPSGGTSASESASQPTVSAASASSTTSAASNS